MLCKKYYLVLAVAILLASVEANHGIVKRNTSQPRKYDCACHAVSNPGQIVSLGVLISAGAVAVLLSALLVIGLTAAFEVILLLSGVVVKVASILAHPQYNPSDHTCDVAILKLSKITSGNNIGPCNIAPSSGFTPPSSVTVFGCSSGLSLGGILGLVGGLVGFLEGLLLVVGSLTVGSCGLAAFNANNLCCKACGIDALGSPMTSGDVLLGLLAKPVNCASGSSGYSNCYDPAVSNFLIANK